MKEATKLYKKYIQQIPSRKEEYHFKNISTERKRQIYSEMEVEGNKKLEIIKNKYNEDIAYILVPGESLNKTISGDVIDFLKDKLVIGIKQTTNICPEIFDFHLINGGNIDKNSIKVSYESESSIVICAADILSNKYHFDSQNINYNIWLNCSHVCSWGNSLSEICNFQDYTLDKSASRRWGPTIMYEIGIYLPLLLGVKKVIIFGWDVCGSYFYKNHEMDNAAARENNMVIKSTPELINFYNSIGVDIKLCSPISKLSIPKISVDDVMGLA